MSAPSETIVLISGLTGFVASNLAVRYLQAGYTVRGTVRSQAKGDAWRKLHSEYSDRLQIAIVPDVIKKGAFAEAIKGVTIFCHVATVVPFGQEAMGRQYNIKTIETAREGNMNALTAALAEPSLKKLVLTSSDAAVLIVLGDGPNGLTFTEKDWNPTTYEDAIAADHPIVAYAYGKTIAEKDTWEFVKTKKPHFAVVCILPSNIYGWPETLPSEDPSNPVIGSNQFISSVLTDPKRDISQVMGGPDMVDVRDVVEAHFLAGTTPHGDNGRFLVSCPGKNYTSKFVKYWRSIYPEYAHTFASVPENYVEPDDYEIDATLITKTYGLKYHSFEDTAKELGDYILSVTQPSFKPSKATQLPFSLNSYPGTYGKQALEFGYNQSVRVGNTIHTSGQGGWDDSTGDLKFPSGYEAEIDQAYDNVLKAIQASGGHSLAEVYKLNVFMSPLSDDLAEALVKVTAKRLPHKPCMLSVGVAKLGLEGMHVEMSAEALVSA